MLVRELRLRTESAGPQVDGKVLARPGPHSVWVRSVPAWYASAHTGAAGT
jgi:hypothetical protein